MQTPMNYHVNIPSVDLQPKQRASPEVHLGGTIIENASKNSNTPPNQLVFAPTLDSAERQLLKDIMVREKNQMFDKNGDLKVLLACGWARNDDLAVLRRFPEVLNMDSTFKTNREDRPLFNIVVKDANNKLRTVFRCILPSEKLSIFNVILT